MDCKSLHKKYQLLEEKFERHQQILIQAYRDIKFKERQLRKLNEELRASEESLKINNEELQAANEEISAINEELYNKNIFIEKQNEELNNALVRLKNLQAELLRSEKMASLGVFTSGMAHEINNPLNFIMSSYYGITAYFNEHGAEDTKRINFLLSSLKEGVDRVSKIIEGLNYFSSFSGSISEDCPLHTILNNCLLILNHKLEKRITVIKNYVSDSLIIKGNTGSLHQAFLHILTNAEQSIIDKGRISICSKITSEHFVIEISDTGKGISKEYIHKITEPFFTTKSPGKGTGLGLAITYSIIKEHGGNIEFESELNKGTLVRVSFPR